MDDENKKGEIAKTDEEKDLEGELRDKLLSMDSKSLLKVFGGVIQKQERDIGKYKTKAEAYDHITGVKGWASMEEVAKVLNYKDLGRNNLCYFLRQIGVFQSGISTKNIPYQRFINAGLFCLKTHDITIDMGGYTTRKIRYTPMASPKGLVWIRKQIEERGIESNENNSE